MANKQGKRKPVAKNATRSPKVTKRSKKTPAPTASKPRAKKPAAKRAKPAKDTAPFESLKYTLGASHHGEIVFRTAEGETGMAFIDARVWPPRITEHRSEGYTYLAARSASGRWLVYASSSSPEACTLRWYDSITATGPSSEAADPMPDRDVWPLYEALPHRRRYALPSVKQRIEALLFLGEDPVVVPMHVGLDGHPLRPLVQRDGAWTELASLPPFAKPADQLSDACPVASTRLSDGTDVLAWNGSLHAARGTALEELWEHPPPDRDALNHSLMHATIAPSAGGGVYAIEGHRLVERRRGERIEVLPGRAVSTIVAGPRGTLVLSHIDDDGSTHLLFDPARDTVASLEPVMTEQDDVAGATDDYLITYDHRKLKRVRFDALAKLPTEPASVAPAGSFVAPLIERKPPTPLALFDEVGMASRTQIAIGGTRIVTGIGDRVRVFELDTPTELVMVPAPIVAVGFLEHPAAIDATGMLRVFGSDVRVQLAPSPRALRTTADGRWLVVGADAAEIVDADGGRHPPIAFAGGVTAAADPDGAIVLVGENRRLALYEHATLSDLPGTAEQVIAIVAIGGRRFVCAGTSNMYLLDLARPELELWSEGHTSAHLATTRDRRQLAFARDNVVFAVGIGTVKPHPREVAEFGLINATVHPTIRGLVYLDDGRLAVGLPQGLGSIVDFAPGIGGDAALRMDPHPGDPPSEYRLKVGADAYE